MDDLGWCGNLIRLRFFFLFLLSSFFPFSFFPFSFLLKDGNGDCAIQAYGLDNGAKGARSRKEWKLRNVLGNCLSDQGEKKLIFHFRRY